MPGEERRVEFRQGHHGLEWPRDGRELWSAVAWTGRRAWKADVASGMTGLKVQAKELRPHAFTHSFIRLFVHAFIHS